jgi:hypothetical protein
MHEKGHWYISKSDVIADHSKYSEPPSSNQSIRNSVMVVASRHNLVGDVYSLSCTAHEQS